MAARVTQEPVVSTDQAAGNQRVTQLPVVSTDQPAGHERVTQFLGASVDQPAGHERVTQFPILVLTPVTPGSCSGPAIVGAEFAPGFLGKMASQKILPYLIIPPGQGQKITEIDGHSSTSQLDIQVIDPGGEIKALAAKVGSTGTSVVGTLARFRMGFPGEDLSDFTVLHTCQIMDLAYEANGLLKFSLHDVQRFLYGKLWLNGGPDPYVAGQTVAQAPPVYQGFADNGVAVLAINPRYLFGHPLDILLVALQNELGVGQDPNIPDSQWIQYDPINNTGLINPNAFIDVPGILALRDNQFAGEHWEFTLTRPQDNGEQWITDDILKPLGLYWIVRQDGRLAVKSMKTPVRTTSQVGLVTISGIITPGDTLSIALNGFNNSYTVLAGNDYAAIAQGLAAAINANPNLTGVVSASGTGNIQLTGGTPFAEVVLTPIGTLTSIAVGASAGATESIVVTQDPTAPPVWNRCNIIGIPSTSREKVTNEVTFRMNVDTDQERERASREYKEEVTFVQLTSVNTFRQEFMEQCEANGMRIVYGGMGRAFLTAQRIFRRWGFATPVFTVRVFLSSLLPELGDYVLLTHPLALDYKAGVRGVTNVLCEVLDRQPHYDHGYFEYQLADTRFMGFVSARGFAPPGTPVYTSATADQKAKYFFIAGTNGSYSNGDPGDAIL